MITVITASRHRSLHGRLQSAFLPLFPSLPSRSCVCACDDRARVCVPRTRCKKRPGRVDTLSGRRADALVIFHLMVINRRHPPFTAKLETRMRGDYGGIIMIGRQADPARCDAVWVAPWQRTLSRRSPWGRGRAPPYGSGVCSAGAGPAVPPATPGRRRMCPQGGVTRRHTAAANAAAAAVARHR